MKKALFLLLLVGPIIAMAQQPKMHIRVFGGTNTTTFLYRIEGVASDVLVGWQVGTGYRIMHRKAFLEIDIMYKNVGITSLPGDDERFDLDDPLELRLKALEFPLVMGYVPVKTPVFKWFLYTGPVSKFNLKGKYEYEDEAGHFKPSELDLHVYNFGWRFGTQADLAMFNFDISYTVSVTDAFKYRARTKTHGIEINVGFAL